MATTSMEVDKSPLLSSLQGSHFNDLPSCWRGIVCGLILFNVCAHIYIVVEQPLLVNYRVKN